MKYTNFFLLLLLLVPLTHVCAQSGVRQKDTIPLRNQLRISIGLGYEDGLIYLPIRSIPTFGLSYERLLHRRVSLSAHMLTYYRALPDSYTLGINNTPILDKFRGTDNPFLTPAEKQALADNTGIKPLDPTHIVKFLSIPVDVGLILYPISRNRHRLGFNIAYSLTYETHSWFKDYGSGVLTLPDGTRQEITITTPVEYRNISAGMNLKLLYDYRFARYVTGLRVGSSNVFFSDWFDANNSVWETSFFFGFQF